MMCRLALILACGLVLAAPSLAGDKPPPLRRGGPCGGSCPQVTWKLMEHGFYGSGQAKTHIYYARTPDQIARWLPYLQKNLNHRALLHLNFSKYGVLAIFHQAVLGDLSVGPVWYLPPDSLQVQISLKPGPACPPGGGSCPLVISGQYFLVKIRKGSLPAPVGLLYIAEVTDP